jgi:two-component sensor histidine kinase
MLLDAPVIETPASPPLQAGSDDVELQMLELRHRMKNILAIVQSLVNQTLRDGVEIGAARQLLSGRLVAIGHAVDLLLGEGWRAARLDRLIQSALASASERVRLTGPEVEIGPSAALMLGILFHELECNAIKYGALSKLDGRVSLSWWLEDGKRLALTWTEQDGPHVEAPAAAGFGSKLITRVAARFGGQADADFRPEGLRWRLTLPLEPLGS